MTTIAGLDLLTRAGHKVSVIGPSEYHYYSGMGPGMLGGTYKSRDIRFHTCRVVEKNGGSFILDTAIRIDPKTQVVHLKSGGEIPYDVLSCNVGSYVPDKHHTDNSLPLFTVKPIAGLVAARDTFLDLTKRKPLAIAIVGGGPSAAEIAGNLLQLAKLFRHPAPHIKIFAGGGFLKGFPSHIVELIERSLSRRGVEFVQDYSNRIQAGQIVTTSEQWHEADMVFMCTGVRPSPIFRDSGIETGPDHGMLVNRFLQSVQYDTIFGGGDCIYFKDQPLDKVGVYAVRQNPVLFKNLAARLEGKPLTAFDPGGNYLLIFNLGEKTGVLHKGSLTLTGKLAFYCKHFIDSRFMRKFQAYER
jgi:NADH dehydrogenase FAD-containing subunit